MTPDHHRYFVKDDEPRAPFTAITEHTLRPVVFLPERHWGDTIRFFRMPTPADSFDQPLEITITDIREGDTILMIDFYPGRLGVLRMMYVTRIEHGEFFYGVVNDFLGYLGPELVDRFAGLLGRVPTE